MNKVPPDIAGKFLKVPIMNEKCKQLVEFAVENKWDRDTLVQWINTTWLEVTGSVYSKPPTKE